MPLIKLRHYVRPRLWPLITRAMWSTERHRTALDIATFAIPSICLGIGLLAANITSVGYSVAIAVGPPATWFGLRVIYVSAKLDAELPPRIGKTTTERFHIRDLERSDSAAFDLSHDSEMLRANGAEAGAFDVRIEAVYMPNDVFRRGIYLAADQTSGEPVAFATLYLIAPDVRHQLGFWLMPQSRGKGLATESLASLLEAIHEAGIEQITIATHADNRPMRATLEGAGCIHETTESRTLPNGVTIQSPRYTHRAKS